MSAQAFTWGAGVSAKTQSGAGVGTSDTYNQHNELDDAALFALTVTAAAAAAGDTLDVWVQHSWDDGTTFDDFIHFTQVLGNGGALSHLCPWTLASSAPNVMHKAVTKTLSAANSPVLGPIGNLWRVQYTVVQASAAAFTFSVSVQAYDLG